MKCNINFLVKRKQLEQWWHQFWYGSLNPNNNKSKMLETAQNKDLFYKRCTASLQHRKTAEKHLYIKIKPFFKLLKCSWLKIIQYIQLLTKINVVISMKRFMKYNYF